MAMMRLVGDVMKKLRLITLLLACLVLGGCGGTTAELKPYAPPEEKRLVIYTSHKAQVYSPIVREFEERTGIWVEVVTGGTNELLERISQESADPKADLIFGGGVESLEVYQDCFAPYRCPQWEHIVPRFRPTTDYWTPFSALPVVLIYNTKLVEPELLTGWADLARPEFLGQVACADPSRSGSSFTALVTHLIVRGEKASDQLAMSLQGRQLSASGEVLSSVADGSCLVGLTLEEAALQRIAAGANIAMVFPQEGTSCIPDGSAVVKDAPHPDNAKAFVDFTLSEDVQRLLVRQLYRRSVLQDIPEDEKMTPMEELHLVDYDPSLAAQYKDQLLSTWETMVGRMEP